MLQILSFYYIKLTKILPNSIMYEVLFDYRTRTTNMMNLIKRVTALSLLLAMFLGLFGGITFVTTSAVSDSSDAITDVNGNPVVNLLADKNWDFDVCLFLRQMVPQVFWATLCQLVL